MPHYLATYLGVAVLLLCSGPAAWAKLPGEDIQPGAKAQIKALLQEKASRTAAQRKLESHLVQAVKQRGGGTFVSGAPRLRQSVQVSAEGRVLVDIQGQVTPGLLALVERGGGQILSATPQFQAIRARVPLAYLETLAAAKAVQFIRCADQARTHAGSVTSAGDVTHLSSAARAAFGATGAGVKIGVLSDNLAHLTNSQASGNLGAVSVLPGQGGSRGSGEGTALLEIIHDLAPDAELYFATAYDGLASFAQNILNLRSNGCQILIDDVSYYNESPFQDGIVAQAINSVTAGGALYVSAAGNWGRQDAGFSRTWEGDFVDGGVVAEPGEGHIHSFGAATFNGLLYGGFDNRVDLFWADPLGAAINDYDLFVLNATGTEVVDFSNTVQDGTGDPHEYISGVVGGERIVIVKYAGEGRFLHLRVLNGQLSVGTPGSITGHAAATNALCVAAVEADTAYPQAFGGGSTNPVAAYSADGPRRTFYQADGTAITPGNYSASGGALRQKPDVAAATGVATSVPGFGYFTGTSAAAAHAAGVAAQVLSRQPGLSATQLRALLTSTALDIAPTGPDRNAGAGILMAYQALQSLTGQGPVAIALQPADQVASVGDSVTFSLTAAGAAPLSYTWRRNGVVVPGATNSSYTLANVQLADSGSQWSCLVSDGKETVPSATAVLTVNPPPANDLCSGALVIASPGYTNTQSTVGATVLGDPTVSCARLQRGVWYQYTATTTGLMVAETTGSDFDTGLALYQGSCGALTELACNDDAGSESTSRLVYEVSAGTTYYLLAGGWRGETGQLVFRLGMAQPPVNDLCAGAIVISGTTYSNTQSTVVALTAGDPGPSCMTDLGGGVWYRYTVPADGRLMVDTLGSDFDTALALYTGACGNLAEVACNDDGDEDYTSQLTLQVTAGTTYYILAGGYDGETGDLVLHLAFAPLVAPRLVSQPASLVVPVGAAVTLSVTASGTAPLSYQWSKDGSAIGGATADSYSIPYAYLSSAGSYAVTVSNAYGSVTSSNAVLTVNLGPVNDQCSRAWAVTTSAGSSSGYSQSTALATTYGDPTPACLTNFGNGVWFKYTAPETALLVADTLRSGFDVGLGLYSGSCDSLTELACNSHGASSTNARIRFPVTAGTTYYLLAAGANGATGQLTLNLALGTPPAISTPPLSQSVSAGGSVTFSVTATGSGYLTYQWFKDGNAIPYAYQSSYSLSSVQGTDAGNYWVVVNSDFGSVTSALATLTVTGLVNDQCASAIVITGNSYTNTQSTTNATATGDPIPYCVSGLGKGVWYRFTPGSSGQLVIDTLGSSFDTGLGLYTGLCGALSQVACDDEGGPANTSSISYQVTGGTTYFILAGGYYSASGTLVLRLNFTPTDGPPLLQSQPASQSVAVGGYASFSVSATGSSPLSYQWFKDGNPIAGATASSFYLSPVQLTNAGTYRVVVTNALGSVTSSNALLTVLPPSVDHFAWDPIGSPQRVNTPFAVRLTAKTAGNVTISNFTGPVTLSAVAPAGLDTSSLLAGVSHSGANPDSNYTDGYAFRPNTDLQVTHVRHMYGSKISIWTDAGLLLASQNVTNQPGAWTETPLATPLTLAAGVRYRISAHYPSFTTTYWNSTNTLPMPFASGVIERGYWAPGDAFPANNGSFLYMVDLRYTAATNAPVTLSPAVAEAFVDGVWTGTVSVPQPATNLVLRAQASSGRWAVSNPFTVAAETTSPTRPGFLAGSAHMLSDGRFQFTLSGTPGATYQIQVSPDLQTWTPLTNISLLTSSSPVVDTNRTPARRFYRALLAP